MRDADSRWPTQFGRGVFVGLGVAFVYSLWVLIVSTRLGTVQPDLGISLSMMIAFYFLGGVVGGLIYGALAPLTRWRIGAAFLGFVISLPLAIGVVIVLPEHGLDERATWVAVLIQAGIVGGLGGLYVFDPPEAG